MAISYNKKRKKKPTGGNPNVPEGAFGGAKDTEKKREPVSEEEELFERLFGGGDRGGTDEQRERLLSLMERWQPRETPSETLTTVRKLNDPLSYEAQKYQARLASDPWGPGGAFEGRRAADMLTPEQLVASQGPSAENQWKSLRKPLTQEQQEAGEFDPEELKRLNAIYRANRTYT